MPQRMGPGRSMRAKRILRRRPLATSPAWHFLCTWERVTRGDGQAQGLNFLASVSIDGAMGLWV